MFFQPLAKRFILITLTFMLPNAGYAAQTLSLKDSVAFSISHNRMLAAASSQVNAAQAQADSATGQLLPRLDLSTGFYRTNSPLNSFGTKLQQQNVATTDFNPALLNNPDYINNYQTRLGLRLPLFAGGANWAARHRASAQADASTFTFKFQKQQLIYQTIAAYVQARQALAQVSAQKNAVHAAKNRWKDAKALKKRGISIESDVMDAYVHVLRSQVALQQAQANHADSIEALRFILGMHAKQTLQQLSEPIIQFPTTHLSSLLEHASTNRADLAALQSRLEAADAAKRQAQAGYYPHINLVAAQEWNSDTFGLKNDNSTVGINITMNLYAGGSDRASSHAAESQRIILALQIQDKRQQIYNEIRQSWRSVQTAKQRLKSETEALKQTVESLRIKSLRHHQGLEKTSDLLDAQVRADASKVTHIQAKYDFMIAKAALLLAAGTLNEEVVQ